MTYSVKEIYYTLQGEGAQTGRPAVFVRFAGCNLWSGRERDRARAICNFCDTEFVGTDGPGGGKFSSAIELAAAVRAEWPDERVNSTPYAVCTGGEPLLQLDEAAIEALHDAGFEIGVETNGTLPAPSGIDWLCVSPKAAAPVVQTEGDELKLVYPQTEPEAQPEKFADMRFSHYFLQPKDCNDDVETQANVQATIQYCLKNPHWKLSLQTHKIIGIQTGRCICRRHFSRAVCVRTDLGSGTCDATGARRSRRIGGSRDPEVIRPRRRRDRNRRSPG